MTGLGDGLEWLFLLSVKISLLCTSLHPNAQDSAIYVLDRYHLPRLNPTPLLEKYELGESA
jgi:hypothetical protein